MSYSDTEMKTLILELAEAAGPQEAEALRELAQNYRDLPEEKGAQYEMRPWHAIAIAIVCYLIWTPIYFLTERPPPAPRPTGQMVEQLGRFEQTPDGRFITQTFKFGPQVVTGNGVREFTYIDVPVVVYEDTTLLPKKNYEFQKLHPQNAWRFVTITTSDGTNPNKNGRRYYAVQP